MFFARLFPRTLAGCFILGTLSSFAAAQEAQHRKEVGAPTQATTPAAGQDGRARLETDVTLVSESEAGEEPAEEARPQAPFADLSGFERVMLAAIEDRIGTPYRLGTEGPNRFDCSGFVWSVFREAGFGFERGSARAFWSQFAPAGGEEKFKFGTLVFFNNLNHVGIVADEHGFYHASTSRGVVYSPFNEYWTKRISGFRRVSHAHTLIASAGR